jgi:hypothetical protein
VRSGLITATEGAKELGVSRKVYYEWEKRALAAMMGALEDRAPGRPLVAADPEKEALQRRVGCLKQKLRLAEDTLKIRTVLRNATETSGPDRRLQDAPAPRKKRRRGN